MSSPVNIDVNVVNNEHHNPLIENRNVLSPETTVSDSHSGDESFNEDKNIIPSTLIEDELKLALNKEASAEELENAISSCKELVLESEQCSLERKWLVRHLIELRLRLQECVDAQVDPLHPRNIGSSVNNRVVLGHHLVLQPFLSVSAITNTKKIHCDHCSGTIWCMFQAWYKCSDCGYSCHYKCITDIVRVCAHLTATEKGNYITDICPEKGISYQKYQCAECKTPLTFTGSSWAEARLCDYDGNYYCTSCHWNSMAVIPARVIHNWDMEKRPVCQASAQLLKITVKQPLIHLEQMNPKLFNFIHELGVVKKLREDLSIMRRYLTVCRKATEQHLLWKLGERHHLIDTTYMYSLQDLVDIHTGDLPSFLQSITDLYIDHIKNDCEICFGQGHLCEICGNNEVIFPFEAGVIICDNCKAVFHKVCWTRKKETCPKCSRLKNKESCVEEKLGDTEEDEDNELGDINQ